MKLLIDGNVFSLNVVDGKRLNHLIIGYIGTENNI